VTPNGISLQGLKGLNESKNFVVQEDDGNGENDDEMV
tara:strand:+ start:1906 stop:2016 length:111 start_codon:yes stop_codon:yes gene_type:complete